MAARAGVVLALSPEDPIRRSLAAQLDPAPAELSGWRDLADVARGRTSLLGATLPSGFELEHLHLLGGRELPSAARRAGAPAAVFAPAAVLQVGDLVVHEDHGIARLEAIETVDAAGQFADHLALSFAGDDRLLAPVAEIGRIWPYGSDEGGMSLDRLEGGTWSRRRDEVAAEIAAVARELARRVQERSKREAPGLKPSESFRRFVRRFPFEPSSDQEAAIAAVLSDLSRGRPPMDRLLCGDVGFGKTEVALRAAAIAALGGRQVAVLAPTTLLVGQHLQTFRRRFAGFGLRVEQLSRLGGGKPAREVRAGLADGSVRIVIGTHALASPEVRFADLALVVIDEEQRFGSAQKEALTRLRQGVHVLTMSATPIPRTLQAALAGLQELSVIATPPQRRVPVRTFLLPFDPAVAREALLRERGRGGRSFVVVPRIADLEPMRARLAAAVPDLDLVLAHGRMRAAELDRVMLAFAEGRHDVLLTTSIVEAGLDVPGADTMLVWQPQRFGMAQLHQLRGRVGRGRERGACYLLPEPGDALADMARRRLEALARIEGLGAGFAVSARDLDLRGAGSILGEEQAGHVQRIGTGLHQELLRRALRRARGETVEPPWTPEVALGVSALLPAEYVPEPDLRLELYARLARITAASELDDLADEIADRFGELPPPARRLLELTRLGLRCQDLAVSRLESGTKAVAATLRPASPLDGRAPAGVRQSGSRLLLDGIGTADGTRLERARELLELIAAAQPKKVRSSASVSSGHSSGR